MTPAGTSRTCPTSTPSLSWGLTMATYSTGARLIPTSIWGASLVLWVGVYSSSLGLRTLGSTRPTEVNDHPSNRHDVPILAWACSGFDVGDGCDLGAIGVRLLDSAAAEHWYWTAVAGERAHLPEDRPGRQAEHAAGTCGATRAGCGSTAGSAAGAGPRDCLRLHRAN